MRGGRGRRRRLCRRGRVGARRRARSCRARCGHSRSGWLGSLCRRGFGGRSIIDTRRAREDINGVPMSTVPATSSAASFRLMMLPSYVSSPSSWTTISSRVSRASPSWGQTARTILSCSTWPVQALWTNRAAHSTEPTLAFTSLSSSARPLDRKHPHRAVAQAHAAVTTTHRRDPAMVAVPEVLALAPDVDLVLSVLVARSPTRVGGAAVGVEAGARGAHRLELVGQDLLGRVVDGDIRAASDRAVRRACR